MEKRIKRLGKCFFLTLGVLGAASLTGCAEDVSALFGSDGTAVEVVPSFSQREKVITRGADNLDNGTSGFGNTSAGVCVKVDQNNSVYTPYQYTINTGGKSVTPPASGPTFPSGGISVNVYGWYPYNSGSTTFSIQSNQQLDANYCLSDLMLANNAVCSRNLSTGEVTAAALSFRHVMAKVKVVLNPQSGITVSAVKLKNVLPTVNINESNVSALTVGAASGDATEVTLLSSGSITSSSTTTEKTLCGVFPEQTFTSAFLVVTAKTSTGSNTDITYSFTGAGKTFEKNNEYVVNLSISPQSLEENAVSLEEWQSAGNNPVNIGGGGGDAPTLMPASLEFTFGDAAETITASNVGSAWSALSDNTNVATVAGLTVTPVNVGTATVHVWPTSDITGAFSSAACPVTVNALELQQTTSSSNGYVTIAAIPDQLYTNSAITPEPAVSVKVSSGSNALTKNTDFTYSYSNNTAVGTNTATVTINPISGGNYVNAIGDAITKTFSIVTCTGEDLSTASVVNGGYICSHGRYFASSIGCGGTALARITYVGSVPGYFDKFLAIAMEDASSSAANWATQMSAANTWASNHPVMVGGTTYNSCSTSAYDQVTTGGTTSMPNSGGTAVKGWRVPSVTDWKYIFAGIGGKAVDNSAVTDGIVYSSGTDSGGSDGSHRALLNIWCGQVWNATTKPQAVQSYYYWSSSERAEYTGNAWRYDFNFSKFSWSSKTGNSYVRAVFAY